MDGASLCRRPKRSQTTAGEHRRLNSRSTLRNDLHTIPHLTAPQFAALLDADRCADLGLAYYGVSQNINNYWDNVFGGFAFDVFKGIVVGVATASSWFGVVPIILDLEAGVIGYEALNLQRTIIAGEMRGYGCV